MDIDDIHEISDYSEMTLLAIVARLRKTGSPEQCIYRETELDELWRIVDIELRLADAGSTRAESLARFRSAIMVAHDLVGMDEKPIEAAAALEQILPLVNSLRWG